MAQATEKRTQIYLTSEQHERAVKLARRRGTTLAAVVREALDQQFARESNDEADWEHDPTLSLVGGLELPAIRGSLNDAIDASVYEEDEPWSLPTAPDSSQPSMPKTGSTRKQPKRGAASRKSARRS